MKAPAFWYPREGEDTSPLIPNLLSFLSPAWRAGAFLRRAVARPYRAKVPLICIGNAVAGGAGKTPTALAVARILQKAGHKPAFITRGYGGRGNVTLVDPAQHSAADVGDEALLLAAVAPTWAGYSRAAAARQAEKFASVILMDDGFQNPHIAPTASLLVFDGPSGIGNGLVIPAGPLREPFAEAVARADFLVIIGEDKHKLAARAGKPALHAHIHPNPLPPGFPREGKFVAFAGIARPEKFYATIRELGLDLAGVADFPDHHPYTAADLDYLQLRAEEQGARLLTTEKDAMRLPPDFLADILTLPVTLVFDEADAESRLVNLCRSPSF
ncbi:MAG: tetraacyldisaccharide 4'-kinase [Alphaproteobacteria bacterium]|nr:tetraacyldisaccharide 4'-kinase [Alphaproteobacteria bacterium]